VRVLDVVGGRLGPSTNVLILGDRIAAVSSSASAASGATIIDGHGETLMPGLIDVHVHLTFGSMLLQTLYDPSTTPEKAGVAAAASAGEMLLRGFTAVRDVGGPIFPLEPP
jgi:imidazolonepropionase-like amidohydrolase